MAISLSCYAQQTTETPWQEVQGDKYQLLLLGKDASTCLPDSGCNQKASQFSAHRLFVEMAKFRQAGDGTKPNIGIVTAGSDKPLTEAARYMQWFEQLGATPIWLPLSADYQQALVLEQQGLQGCAQFNHPNVAQAALSPLHQQRYQLCRSPEQLQQTLQSLQGLYIADGNVLRAVQGFFQPDGAPGPMLMTLRRMVQSDRLAVAASGEAIRLLSGGQHEDRPVPMLVGGDTVQAFQNGAFAVPLGCENISVCLELAADNLSYLSQGGLGLFNLGIVDTRLSEQDGQGRLALLAMHTGTRFGIGLDKQAALLVGWRNQSIALRIAGRGGVFIVDSAQGIYKLQGGKRQLVAMSHYLNPGDTASYQFAQQNWQFSLTKQPVSNQPSSGLWRTELDSHCGTQTPLRWQQGALAIVAMPSEDSRFSHTADQTLRPCSYHDLPFGIEN
ncbi:hypothetical protein [Bowmanella pacifica]|uniref:Cyanophycinase n=1 Tax=Bowmanella pacifica TaxID=502051 RepID=A0A918DKQ7_9ALTE|nr:hypothetical protein [Bowmanella pacifica]GGO72634.1 hypothetical protein GCM10010982_31230 [Bowmanella pacifica]